MTDNLQTLLKLENLSVHFDTEDGRVDAVLGLNCQVRKGQCLGVVGESGSGKSQTFLAMAGLLASNGHASGSALFEGNEILGLPEAQLNTLRGSRFSMIFQNPLTSLTPHLRIGEQMRETLSTHRKLDRKTANAVSLEWLERVHIPDPQRRIQQFPHELSGGMRQRVMIAMAMLCEPALLIADEPTTALDVTIQAEILELMSELQKTHDTAIILITHDMGVVARMCDDVVVMEKGHVVEAGSINDIFYSPQHEYTQRLLDAVPVIDTEASAASATGASSSEQTPLLQADSITVKFPVDNGFLRRPGEFTAVRALSLSLQTGETLGIVGESGSGKSTLARAILQLLPHGGRVSWLGQAIDPSKQQELKQLKKNMQIVFQDPLASLNPSITVGESVREPLRVLRNDLDRRQMDARVHDMFERVGLDSRLINRFPHELSGGQNQRIGIARAMISEPSLIICDEAVSALDVSVQAQVLRLLKSLQADLGISYLFISHDLAVVWEISDRILVMYAGSTIEYAPRHTLFATPQHPYTQQLISAVPLPDPEQERRRKRLLFRQDLPGPSDAAARLRFMPNKLATDPGYLPALQQVGDQHFVAEHEPLESLLFQPV